MTAKIDYRSFTVAIERLNKGSATLQQELVNNLHESGPKIEAEMHGKAHTRVQQRAASTVRISNDSKGITVQGGGGGGLSGALFAGGEFGGRKGKKRPYATRSPNGVAYVVRRRTTMQFLVHLGTEGYFYFPTLRRVLPELLKKQIETVEKSVGGK